MKGLIREPLLHFLLIGAGLFLLFGWRGNPAAVPGGQPGPASAKIVVTRGDIDQLVATFTRTWQRPPSDEEAKGLVENFVREEIYYREGLAMGLDRDDGVIRRRMRQKMEFILEDVSAQMEPTDEDLGTFMRKHPERYLVDPRIAFTQVYVSTDKRGANADAEARRLLGQLNAGADPETLGDAFVLERDVGLSPLWEIRTQFGEEFGKSLLGLTPGRWEGPVRSGYGLHLVLVGSRVDGRMPELDAVRETVKRDWTAGRQKELKDAAYAKMLERYTVEIEKPGPSPAPVQAGSGVVSR